jgi:hypothetical protein
MSKKILILAISLCLMLGILAPAYGPVLAAGQGSISVNNSKVTSDFPTTMTFSSQIKSSSNITDVRLRYRVDQMTFADIFSEGYVTFTSAPSVNVNYKLDMRRFGGFPPGTAIQYWWVVKDAGGAFLETPAESFSVNDNRYNWKNLTDRKIKIYWYQGDNAFAQALMDTAQSSLIKLADDTGASPQKPISIYIYANSDDLQGSMIFPSEWTGGVSFTQYNIITIGISPANLDWGKGAMTHELTHNVVGQVIFNPYNEIPVWLNEGLAMRSEGKLTNQFSQPLAQAIKSNKLLTVRMISSPFSAYSDKANLSYAESYTVVEFVIEKYGAEKMSELLLAFKKGNTFDGAFQQVLGIDLDALNQEWQTWIKTTYAQ